MHENLNILVSERCLPISFHDKLIERFLLASELAYVAR
jgi:hypothetical protein